MNPVDFSAVGFVKDPGILRRHVAAGRFIGGSIKGRLDRAGCEVSAILAFVFVRMLGVFFPVGRVLLGNRLVPDDSRFSALFSSAAFVKLKLPVMTTSPSRIMILLWAMACLASISVGMPACSTKSAAE